MTCTLTATVNKIKCSRWPRSSRKSERSDVSNLDSSKNDRAVRFRPDPLLSPPRVLHRAPYRNFPECHLCRMCFRTSAPQLAPGCVCTI
jgi:hypothetical protein